jgi:hypothetical protein
MHCSTDELYVLLCVVLLKQVVFCYFSKKGYLAISEQANVEQSFIVNLLRIMDFIGYNSAVVFNFCAVIGFVKYV